MTKIIPPAGNFSSYIIIISTQQHTMDNIKLALILLLIILVS